MSECIIEGCNISVFRDPITRRSFPREAFLRDDAQRYVSPRCDSRAETYPCASSRGNASRGKDRPLIPTQVSALSMFLCTHLVGECTCMLDCHYFCEYSSQRARCHSTDWSWRNAANSFIRVCTPCRPAPGQRRRRPLHAVAAKPMTRKSNLHMRALSYCFRSS